MARQPKKTLDYITLDCVDKTTLKRLQRKFGPEGRLFWYELLRLIGRSESYLIDLSDDWNREDVIEEELFVSKEKGESILNALAEWGNIDFDTWKEFKIIWCQDLIDRHSDLWRKRKHTPTNPFKSDRNNSTTVQKYTTTVPNNSSNTIKAAEIPQSKVKESKVKESKDDDESSSEDVLVDIDTIFSNYLKNSRLKKAVTGSQKISELELEDYLKEFVEKLKSEGKFAKTDDDFKSHFVRWLKIQLKNKKPNGKLTGANAAYD